jgi:TPR repeat protein
MVALFFCPKSRKEAAMPKIIFTSQYMRDAPPARLENYVKYIGTREGVEKIDESRLLLPATVKQQQLIGQIIRDIPSAKDMLEYADYWESPTTGNATEFISMSLEQNLNLIGKRENYVDYIANRPRVERIGEHGLFTDAGTPVVLSQVRDDAVNHKGAVWTHVISLRREDATRLGYDSGKQWQDFIRSKKAMLSKYMKIDSENLRWYCAFHNESHHPHVHLMVYSAKDNDGFLTEPAIEAMRSEIAHDIFRQDFANIYEQQNEARSSLKQGSAAVMEELLRQSALGTCENRVIEEKVLLLSQRLQNTGGKKVYGYLKVDVKTIIDQIVDELAKEEQVAKLYTTWGDWQNEIMKTYTNKTVPLPPLSQQKQFKSIKNMVITEALKIGSHFFTFEDEIAPEPVPPDEVTPNDYEPMLDNADFYEPQETTDITFHVGWSDQYKLARQYLYGSDTIEQNIEEAYKLFLLEAESGNALAMHDLGRMFAAGLGTEQSYKQAASWFSQAVEKNHKYAEYSLGGLYYRGQGVPQSYETALNLYVRSANQGNPYADYELAKMYRDGIGTQKNTEEADRYFKSAFVGFSSLEVQSHDDKLQYRIGQMLYTGTGIKKDIPAAISYFEKSAKLGNVNAQYLLGKLWLETGTGDPLKAVAWIEKAADGGNASAQYALAKFYRDGIYVEKDMQKALKLFTLSAEQKNDYAAYQLGRLYYRNEDIPKDITTAVKWLTFSSDLGNQFAQYALAKLYSLGGDVPKNISKAIKLFTLSAEQKNEYAEYQLGKLYLFGEDVPKNVEAAIRWLTASAEQGNQFAQYALGKLYFFDSDVPRDKEKSLYWLTASAAQGNIYAQFLIDHINEYRSPSVLLAATRLMHRLENLFREDYRKANGGNVFHIDRKRRRKLQEKKQAGGHARDDHEQQQHQFTL